MKSKLVCFVALLLIFLAISPAFSDEIELGMSLTPFEKYGVDDPRYLEAENTDMITGFHLGYAWFGILYASWDALVMPPSFIQDWTGYDKPGFMHLFDIGVRFALGPVVGIAEVGLNSLYVYRQEEDGLQFQSEMGANLRLGAGLKFGTWGIMLTGTSVFPSFKDLTQTLAALGNSNLRSLALKRIEDGLIPSLNFILYL